LTTTREQLVADWQQRLADSSGIENELPSRAAWLKRLRTRLYRFLLSLYGRGDWNAARPPVGTKSLNDATNSVVFDAPGVFPLEGRPAKGDVKIRAVLDKVARAQEHHLSPGKLTAQRVAHESFIVVAHSTCLDVQRCRSLLQYVGIECRLRAIAGDTVLEVSGPLRKIAIHVLDLHRHELRLTRGHAAGQRKRFVVSVFTLTIAIPLAFSLPFVAAASLLVQRPPDSATFLVQLVAAMTTLWLPIVLFKLWQRSRGDAALTHIASGTNRS
jgi:hypothetical protein